MRTYLHSGQQRDDKVTFLLSLFLLCISSLLLVRSANAQSGSGIGEDTGTVNAPPLVRLWNWPDSTFVIGAYAGGVRDTSDQSSAIWPFLESMGINVLIPDNIWVPGNVSDSLTALRRFDTLAWSANVGLGERIIYGQNLFSRDMGTAREVQFYPFDSVQSPYYPFRFSSTLNPVPGAYRVNPVELDSAYKRPVQERVYDSTSTTPGAMVAQDIAFNDWQKDSWRIYRWPSQTSTPDSVQDVLRWITDDLYHEGNLDSIYYLVVTGHLFDQGTSSLSDSLLKIEVLYEVPQGEKYYGSFFTFTASADTTMPVTTFYITKSQFFPLGSPPYTWDAYRQVVFPLDMRKRVGGSRGPTSPSVASGVSRRFNFRLSWIGGERIALRSIALRDIAGQLSLGNDSAAIAWRQSRLGLMRRVLYGADSYGLPDDSLRRAHFALYGGEEPLATEYAGQQALIRMLADTFNVARPGVAGARDSVQIYDAQSGYGSGFHGHRLTAPPIVSVENYLHSLPATTPQDSITITQRFGLRYEEIPSIAEENGGRFHLDSIDLSDPTSIEEYEKTLQRTLLGQYRPSIEGLSDADVKYWLINWGDIAGLGPAARVSRATGRRLIQLPSINANMDFHLYQEGSLWKLDTIVGHFPTEGELRGLVNIGLAYGVKGFIYWTLGSSNAGLNGRHQNGTDTLWGTLSPLGGSFGPIGCTYEGSFTDDTVTDVTDFTFHSSFSHEPSKPRITIDSFYVGFGARTRAIKRLNARLIELGRVMSGLTWRESYSLHYTVAWPLESGMNNFGYRPMDTNEIIREVTARSPITGKTDSAWATYVELGLFDKVIDSTGGTYDAAKDKYYAYVVNRRTFQRPDWIDPNSARGMRMDSLAESRIVTLRFHLPGPDPTQYPFIRVREILPPIDTLPVLGPRHALDTVICSLDSTASLVLGPGMGTLLEVSFPPPDTSIIAGDLRWPGQRKFIYDGKRYHSFYHKARNLPGGGTDNVVIWRWSFPVVDTTGAILWSPAPEVVISDSLFPGQSGRTDNRFPSFTLRRVADSTWITVVWTCHPKASGHTGEREVVGRNMEVVDVIQPYPYHEILGYNLSPIYTVDYHKGTNPEQWGTPVVSFTHGAAVVAWSDSALGIVGRLFPLKLSPPTWLFTLPTLSGRDSISWPERQTYGYPGQYPTLPPWTPTARADSTVGISWRQPAASSQDILYQRLGHTAANALTTLKPGALILAPWLASRWYPSIDIIQDTSGVDQNEGVVWEDDFSGYKTLQFQSLKTSASGLTSLWNRASYIVRINDSITTWPSGELFPQTSVLGEHDTTLFGAGRIQFALGYQRPVTGGTPDLWQALVDWGRSTFKSNWPNRYSYNGRYPNVAVNRNQLWRREAILYQAHAVGGTDSTLRTSRQFFAKYARPTGYQATGRSVLFRLDGKTRTGAYVLFYDPWFADAEKAGALEMSDRDTSLSDVTAPEDLAELFRTEPFTTSDSVTVGCTLYGQFFGGATEVGSVDVIVELVDSATGEAVAELDSVRVSGGTDSVAIYPERTLDLLSGTYYLRARFASTSVDSVGYDCLYPVTEVAGWVENVPAAKGVRRIGEEGGVGISRIDAGPNPFRDETEIRFSIGRRDYVRVTVYDALGREVERLVDGELLEKGRYEVSFSGRGLSPGTYMIELRTSFEQVIDKVVLVR